MTAHITSLSAALTALERLPFPATSTVEIKYDGEFGGGCDVAVFLERDTPMADAVELVRALTDAPVITGSGEGYIDATVDSHEVTVFLPSSRGYGDKLAMATGATFEESR